MNRNLFSFLLEQNDAVSIISSLKWNINIKRNKYIHYNFPWAANNDLLPVKAPQGKLF
jgi:hypothetical protein